MLREIILVGCGGFIGSAGRYTISRLITSACTGAFPLATLGVNLLGCFLIGLLCGLLQNSRLLSPQMSLLLIAGFCGGFTTFSTFANEVWLLAGRGQWLIATAYAALSVIAGTAAVFLGRYLTCP